MSSPGHGEVTVSIEDIWQEAERRVKHLGGNSRQRRRARRALEMAFAEWAESRALTWDGPGE